MPPIGRFPSLWKSVLRFSPLRLLCAGAALLRNLLTRRLQDTQTLKAVITDRDSVPLLSRPASTAWDRTHGTWPSETWILLAVASLRDKVSCWGLRCDRPDNGLKLDCLAEGFGQAAATFCQRISGETLLLPSYLSAVASAGNPRSPPARNFVCFGSSEPSRGPEPHGLF